MTRVWPASEASGAVKCTDELVGVNDEPLAVRNLVDFTTAMRGLVSQSVRPLALHFRRRRGREVAQLWDDARVLRVRRVWTASLARARERIRLRRAAAAIPQPTFIPRSARVTCAAGSRNTTLRLSLSLSLPRRRLVVALARRETRRESALAERRFVSFSFGTSRSSARESRPRESVESQKLSLSLSLGVENESLTQPCADRRHWDALDYDNDDCASDDSDDCAERA